MVAIVSDKIIKNMVAKLNIPEDDRLSVAPFKMAASKPAAMPGVTAMKTRPILPYLFKF